MKFLIILIFSLCSIMVQAQAPQSKSYGTPQERAKLQTEKMKTALPLRSDQFDAVYALNLKYAEIMQKEVFDQGASQWSMYTQGSQINKRKEVELKKLLSAAQFKNYEKLKAEMRKQMQKEGMPKSLDDFK
ncbi:hypothetical protein [Haliscomenobacter hydrossis]|uniref:DUF4890 domain-containing protein n=1 Tax=Haliscomenobacter hydrossis (strain ATCC 27775 / DSM 1100 / LMG 10767 / O) TaxID=760192 RepID=F4KZ07_HALH1|nr:hypothetical protein [Haliscomenobacter hydrossis]AEE52694.1 hypothetical protein Halhy_4864 [Haliscomenobacter hydrossis DSM 1100]